MAYEIGFVDNVGDLAHCKMVDVIRTLAEVNGWTVLRNVSSAGYREIILRGAGFSGVDNIFVGFKTYHSVSSDYYNILCGVFTGYVSGNTFETQPNAYLSGTPCHNNRVDYWLLVNPQRITGSMKVGTPVYEPFYVGKFFQYGRPSQYPYPVICGGSFNGAAATRFSDGSHNMYLRGGANNRLGLRTNNNWINPNVDPYNGLLNVYATRDTNNKYALQPIELYGSDGLFGALDGVFYISGFNNAVENTIDIGGIQFVVMQDVWRTGFSDFYALRMQ